MDHRLPIQPVAVPAPFGVGETAQVLTLLRDGLADGLGAALVTLVGIDGGSPRALGAHMAVLADGRYCGFVSGGCVEAAVATEALGIMRSGAGRTLRFGTGSPFFDIKLPCGGGIDLLVTPIRDRDAMAALGDAMAQRRSMALALGPDALGPDAVTPAAGDRTGWRGQRFVRRYSPPLRLVILGRGPETSVLAHLARAACAEVFCLSPDRDGVDGQAASQEAIRRLADAETAVIALLHDHGAEAELLAAALDTDAFFIGALGSRTTHARRGAALAAIGVPEAAIARIRGPIGAFGPARDPATLAVSIMAELAALRPLGD